MTRDERIAGAMLLLGDRKRPRLGEVWCAFHEHRLGAVFDLPGHGRVLAVGPEDDEHGETFNPWLFDLDGEDFKTYRRCHHGSWAIQVSVVRRDLEQGRRLSFAHSRAWRSPDTV